LNDRQGALALRGQETQESSRKTLVSHQGTKIDKKAAGRKIRQMKRGKIVDIGKNGCGEKVVRLYQCDRPQRIDPNQKENKEENVSTGCTTSTAAQEETLSRYRRTRATCKIRIRRETQGVKATSGGNVTSNR